MIKKKIWLAGLCLVILTLFLFSANITLAQERLAIYTTLDEPLARAVLAAFEEDTGIGVDFLLYQHDLAQIFNFYRAESQFWVQFFKL